MPRELDWSRSGTTKKKRHRVRLVLCDRYMDRRMRCYPKLRLCRISKNPSCRNYGADASLILSYPYLSWLDDPCLLWDTLWGCEWVQRVGHTRSHKGCVALCESLLVLGPRSGDWRLNPEVQDGDISGMGWYVAGYKGIVQPGRTVLIVFPINTPCYPRIRSGFVPLVRLEGAKVSPIFLADDKAVRGDGEA